MHPNFGQIEDKIECVKTILKMKLDEKTYDAVAYELDQIKALERAAFLGKNE